MSGASRVGSAVVFPGQGAQRVGMAKDFVAAYPESAAVFAAASAATGLDMAELCFTENEQLNQTEFTQPAILTAEIAMFAALKAHYGFAPRVFAGHSLGEYTALVAAGVVPLEAAVQIVRKRGALMQQAVPLGVGAMAALISDDLATFDYQAVVKETGAEIANFNSAKQVVISGPKAAVEEASRVLKEKFPTLTVIPLNVSAPAPILVRAPVVAAPVAPGSSSVVPAWVTSKVAATPVLIVKLRLMVTLGPVYCSVPLPPKTRLEAVAADCPIPLGEPPLARVPTLSMPALMVVAPP